MANKIIHTIGHLCLLGHMAGFGLLIRYIIMHHGVGYNTQLICALGTLSLAIAICFVASCALCVENNKVFYFIIGMLSVILCIYPMCVGFLPCPQCDPVTYYVNLIAAVLGVCFYSGGAALLCVIACKKNELPADRPVEGREDSDSDVSVDEILANAQYNDNMV